MEVTEILSMISALIVVVAWAVLFAFTVKRTVDYKRRKKCKKITNLLRMGLRETAEFIDIKWYNTHVRI